MREFALVRQNLGVLCKRHPRPVRRRGRRDEGRTRDRDCISTPGGGCLTVEQRPELVLAVAAVEVDETIHGQRNTRRAGIHRLIRGVVVLAPKTDTEAVARAETREREALLGAACNILNAEDLLREGLERVGIGHLGHINLAAELLATIIEVGLLELRLGQTPASGERRHGRYDRRVADEELITLLELHIHLDRAGEEIRRQRQVLLLRRGRVVRELDIDIGRAL